MMPRMQGQDKYTLFATAHGKAAMQYKARSSSLRASGDTKGANKHARIGRLHDAAFKAISKIARAHAKEFERGRQAQMLATKLVKEEVDVTAVNEAYNSLLQSVIDRKPVDFAEVFEQMIRERVTEKVEDLKIDVAQATFAVEEEVVDEGKTFRRDDEGEEKKEKFQKRRSERHKREIVDEGKTFRHDDEEDENRREKFTKRRLERNKREVVDEEVEELDEISSNLAKRYLAKAEGEYASARHTIDKGDVDKAPEARKKAKKRFAGIERASFREDVESFLEGLTEDQYEAFQELFGKGG